MFKFPYDTIKMRHKHKNRPRETSVCSNVPSLPVYSVFFFLCLYMSLVPIP